MIYKPRYEKHKDCNSYRPCCVCKERKVAQREYYQHNKKRILSQHEKWVKKNREHVNAYMRMRWENNINGVKEYSRKYYQKYGR